MTLSFGRDDAGIYFFVLLIEFEDAFLIVNSYPSSLHQSSLAVALVRKLIAVLESTERLPVITYDHGGGGSGLQVC